VNLIRKKKYKFFIQKSKNLLGEVGVRRPVGEVPGHEVGHVGVGLALPVPPHPLGGVGGHRVDALIITLKIKEALVNKYFLINLIKENIFP
jgi:hypothetical protein